jgi:hypothetical protein
MIVKFKGKTHVFNPLQIHDFMAYAKKVHNPTIRFTSDKLIDFNGSCVTKKQGFYGYEDMARNKDD